MWRGLEEVLQANFCVTFCKFVDIAILMMYHFLAPQSHGITCYRISISNSEIDFLPSLSASKVFTEARFGDLRRDLLGLDYSIASSQTNLSLCSCSNQKNVSGSPAHE